MSVTVSSWQSHTTARFIGSSWLGLLPLRKGFACVPWLCQRVWWEHDQTKCWANDGQIMSRSVTWRYNQQWLPPVVRLLKLLETLSALLPGEGSPMCNSHGSNVARQTVACAAGKHATSFQPLTEHLMLIRSFQPQSQELEPLNLWIYADFVWKIKKCIPLCGQINECHLMLVNVNYIWYTDNGWVPVYTLSVSVSETILLWFWRPVTRVTCHKKSIQNDSIQRPAVEQCDSPDNINCPHHPTSTEGWEWIHRDLSDLSDLSTSRQESTSAKGQSASQTDPSATDTEMSQNLNNTKYSEHSLT